MDASTAPRERELNGHIGIGQTCCFLGPLDQTDGIGVEVLAEPAVAQILLVVEPIKIKVIQV